MTRSTKLFTLLPTVLLLSLSANATNLEPETINDSLNVIDAKDVVVRSSSKETNSPWKTPNSLSVLTPFKINNRQINDIKDLSTVIPNFFIPEYGSKMVTPVYLRGIGTRSSGQSVGLYVDDIPYMDKSSFDFMLMDVQRIEVLRGPQGTLYGRNAMAGIVNIYTLSPFEYQGTKISMGAGNFGLFETKASTYQKFSDKVAISLGAYWQKDDGYIENGLTHKNADGGTSSGGRVKLDWKINDNLTAAIAASVDYTDENAYPYGLYDETTGEVAAPMINERSTYSRIMSNNSVRFDYRKNDIMLTSNTGYQYLDDNMNMDQDFTERDIFTLNQKQKQHSINQEFTVKSTHDGNYQWSVGAFGFYNAMETNSNVKLFQEMFDNMLPENMPFNLTIDNSNNMPNPGLFKTPSWGAALFHQSTFNNVITEGLSFTVGVRLDYEKQELDYNTSMVADFTLKPKPHIPFPSIDLPPTTISSVGTEQQDYLRVLPRVSIKYECSPEIMTYFNASSGYRAGGYNIQMFSQILQNQMMGQLMPGAPGGNEMTIQEQVSYKPETVWSFEIGSRGKLFDGVLNYDFAAFFMLVENMQLTQFIDGGSGRIISNAGKGETAGVEVALNYNPVQNLNFDVSYGFTHSIFTDYVVNDPDGETDYNGNFVPYIPMHTFSVGANYTFKLNGWLEALTLGVNYNGAGKFFWDEKNSVSQDFYGLLDAKIVLRSGWARLELWGKNLTNTNYNTFYFESFDNKFMQIGRPTSFGATIGFTF